MKKVSLSPFNIIGIVFFIFGMIFVVLGGIFLYNTIKFKEIAKTCDALITNIDVYHDSDGDTNHNVFVQYEVDGRVYNEELNYYSSGMYEGEVITIYYDPANPTRILDDSIGIVAVVFIGMGSVFAIIGLVFLIKAIKDKKIIKKVLAMNCIIQAPIIDFSFNKNLTVNGRHPYVLRASSVAPYDGKTYIFESESVWEDLTLVIKGMNITKVPVYVNPQNYKEYYIDIDYFKNYLGNKVN